MSWPAVDVGRAAPARHVKGAPVYSPGANQVTPGTPCRARQPPAKGGRERRGHEKRRRPGHNRWWFDADGARLVQTACQKSARHYSIYSRERKRKIRVWKVKIRPWKNS